MKKMTDYSMDDESWKTRSELIREHLKNNDLGKMNKVIEWNLNQGESDVANRKRFWTSIKTLFGMIENSPITPELDCDLPVEEEDEEEDEEFENNCPYCYYESNESWSQCPECEIFCAGCSSSNLSTYFCDNSDCSTHMTKTKICRSCHKECPNCPGDDYYEQMYDEDDSTGKDNYSHDDEL